MASEFLRKAIFLLLIILFNQNVFSTLVRKTLLHPIQDCKKEFQDQCVKECNDLKRILCYCKDYKVADQINHKCLCAADKSECDNELLNFIKKL